MALVTHDLLLFLSLSLSWADPTPGILEARICCPGTQTLSLDFVGSPHMEGPSYVLNCGEETSRNVVGSKVWVGDQESILKSLGVRQPTCQKGLVLSPVRRKEEQTQGYNDTRTDIPSMGDKYLTSLNPNGSLEFLTKSYFGSKTVILPQGEFCLTGANPQYTRETGQVFAAFCEPCYSQVACYYSKVLFSGPAFGIANRRGQITKEMDGFVRDGIMKLADKNNDNIVEFEEFSEMMRNYLRVLYRIFDENDDNSITEEAQSHRILKHFPLEFFENIFVHALEFLDTSNDNAIGTDDAFYSGRNSGGPFPLSDVLGRPPINLPAPLYDLYTKLDRNKDEKISQEEGIDFIKRTFSLIDFNSDCFIDDDEIVDLLNKLNVPFDMSLAFKLVLQKYTTMLSSLMEEIVSRADINMDNSTTVEEFLGFQDFQLIPLLNPLIHVIGRPDSGEFTHLFPLYDGPRRQEAKIEVAMKALQALMDQDEYTKTNPTTTCPGVLPRQGKKNSCQGSILIVGGRKKNERGGFEGLSSAELFGCGDCTELSLPVSRTDHLSGLTHDGVILVCGGYDPTGRDVNNCISYNRVSRTWDQHSTLPGVWGGSGSRIAFTETGTYILGGLDGRKSIVFLPVGSNTWTVGPEIPGKGGSTSCVTSVNSTHIMVTGGPRPLEPRQIRILDVTTNTWKKLPNLPFGVKGHACIMTKDGVMVTGGLITDTGKISGQTLIIDPNTGRIQEVGPLVTPRYWHSMTMVGDTVMVVGGNDGRYNYLASTEQYKSGSWETGQFTLDTGRDQFGMITIPDNITCN